MGVEHRFQPGHPKLPGAGRPKGQPNKTTTSLKEALLLAATAAGGGDLVAYLTKMAIEQPSSFLSLLGRVLPLQLQGDSEKPLTVRRVEYVIVDVRADPPVMEIEHQNGGKQ